jgi:DNA-binding SARP family transcriptional activator/tetratricopeptide (TPR) repeat protein
MTLRIITLGTLSVRGDKGTVAGAAAQPRRLALLALLARAGDRGVTREKLTALVWPDSDEERSRRAITQSIYALRQELGSDDTIVGVKELHLNSELITSDVSEFSAALKSGKPEDAIRVYAGPFLDGFHLAGNDEFDRWIDSERAVLLQEYLEALEKLATAAYERGDHAVACGWWRRLSAKDPLSARYAIGVMQSLMTAGDKHGALEHARIHETLLEEQLDLPADRDVVALAARIRRELRAGARAEAELQAAQTPVAVAEPPHITLPPNGDDGAAVVSAPSPNVYVAPAPAPVPDPPPPRRIEARVAPEPPGPLIVAETPERRRQRRWMQLAAGAAGLALLAAVAVYARGRNASAADNDPVVAVGRITDYSTTTDRRYGLPLGDLLATNLARVEGLHVVSTARMLELLRRTAAAGGDTTAAAVLSAARLAGATELIDGIVYTRPDGRLRLDLRRIGVRNGDILQAQTVEGADLFALVDSGTARLVAAHGAAPPPSAVSSVTTKSVGAYSLYAQGLRANANGDQTGARNLFGAALREDSTFAMAAYQNARLQPYRTDLVSGLDNAMRLSAKASDRERLLIHAGWAAAVIARDLGAVADSLVARYPQEKEGHLYQGMALLQTGDFMGAAAPFERVIAIDSLSFTRVDSTSGCIACDAFGQLVLAYELADSLPAAERIARRWTRLDPESSRSWTSLWDVLWRQGRFDEAQKVAAHIAQIDRDAITATDRTALTAIRMGNFDLADRVLRGAIQGSSTAAQSDALWDLGLSLRQQGRIDEAIDVARQYRVLGDRAARTRPNETSSAARPLAAALFDAGRYREAAVLFDSAANFRLTEELPASHARDRAWSLTHAARSLAAAGDTSQLAVRADTIAAVSMLSASARDHRLASYIRGLLLFARNDLLNAAVAIRSSIYSLPGGLTRENYDLARIYLRLGRPRDAIDVLQPALRGKLDASNFYVTHTELHELLAQAWDSAGRKDSASVHYAWVARAWEHGDPPYAKRAEAARRAITERSSPRD